MYQIQQVTQSIRDTATRGPFGHRDDTSDPTAGLHSGLDANLRGFRSASFSETLRLLGRRERERERSADPAPCDAERSSSTRIKTSENAVQTVS